MRDIGRLASVAALTAVLGCTALAGLDAYEVVGGGHGGAAGGGGEPGGGGAGGCTSPADCPGEDATCRYRTCERGICGLANADEGTVCAEGGGESCDGDGSCVLASGSQCTGGDVCITGVCQDDVCCDTSCAGSCEACSAAKSGGADGVCGPIPALQDPDGECSSPPLGCSGAGSCATCGQTAEPLGGTCPAICHGCENGDTCVFDCDAADECQLATIDCPAGWHCRVNCAGDHGCTDATIHCPADYACTVTCTDGQHKCERADVHCSARGPCSVTCGGADTCRDAVIHCGENDCAASCAGGDFPSLDGCPVSCACTGCA